MSKHILVNLDLNKNELQNAVIQPLAAAPESPVLGQIFFDSVNKLLKIFDGTNFIDVGPVVSVAGKTGVVVLVKDDVGLGNVDNTSDATKKTNFTGSIASGDTGFVTGGDAYTELEKKLDLDGTDVMTGNLQMNSHKITGVTDPTSDQDAATKKYVDDKISAIGTIITFEGVKATTDLLPLTNMRKGMVWIVSADGSEWIWVSNNSSESTIEAGYEKLGPIIDLSGYAPLASPAFTGTPTAPTAALGTDTTQIATTEFVQNEIDDIDGLVSIATGTIATNATTCSVSYSGTLVNAYATMSGYTIITDVSVGVSAVTFTVSAVPASAITCTVLYIPAST